MKRFTGLRMLLGGFTAALLLAGAGAAGTLLKAWDKAWDRHRRARFRGGMDSSNDL